MLTVQSKILMEKTKQWYVVYTRAGEEQKVCDALRRRKIDSFYPVNRLVKTSYGRERISFIPLMERYVFVHISGSETEEVRNLDCVISFVHWLSKPVVIDSDDIRLMKRFCERHNDIRLEKTKVISLEPAYLSTYDTDRDTERVNLHFPVLGYNMTAEEAKTRVKVITVNDYQTKPESSNQYAETR